MKKSLLLIIIFTILTGCNSKKSTIDETKVTQIIKTSSSQTSQSTSKQSAVSVVSNQDESTKLVKINYDYLGALKTVDRFLADWLNRDWKSLEPLFTDEARKKLPKNYDAYILGPPGHIAYEVVGYKKINQNQYQFKIKIYDGSTSSAEVGSTGWYIMNVIRVKKYTWLINNAPGGFRMEDFIQHK